MLAATFSDPNVAFVLLVLGALGVYWEMHAPGMIVPGVLGLLLIFAGAYGMYQDSPTWYGLLLLICAGLLLGIELKYYTHMVSGMAGAALLALGTILLLHGPERVSPALAVAVSAAFGVIVVFLGWLGMRARTATRLTGLQTLIGETGEARTPLNPEGTVFVNGEYWQAKSNHLIDAGRKVRVERIENMTIWVTEA
jgi:membrane-bound serine protease (ClpP class)